MAEVSVGSEVAGHRIESVIARGGMGIVYRAIHLGLGRPVALKLIAPELARDLAFRQRFIGEARIAASIDHPHVVPLYEAGEDGELLYMAMRLVEGTDLRTLIGREGPLTAARAVRLVRQVGDALDAAHSRGLVHRDVKPANILIATGDHAYLTDFGLTKLAASTGLTKTGMVIGTLDYIAPEQLQGQPVDARTDVYALGCVLFHSLAGRPPFVREDDMAKMFAHVNDPPPSLQAERPDVPAALDAVIARALAKNPDDRYPSAGDLGEAALAAVEGRAPASPERSVATGAAAIGIAGAGALGGAAAAAAADSQPPTVPLAGAPAPAAAAPAAPSPQMQAGSPLGPPPAPPPPPAAPLPAHPPPPPYAAPGEDRRRGSPWAIAAVATVALLVAGTIGGILLLRGDGDGDEPRRVAATDDSNKQTVRFQPPTAPGPDPFTDPVDVSGSDRVRVGSGPFGGTGSDLVCDRELLISSLRARTDRLRAWAGIRRLRPTIGTVARYIRSLRPVTITRDTRITNHSFEGGRAIAFQSILQAGTAVLVDRDGDIVARCRCGNPVLEPIHFAEAVCIGCPAHYTPPAPCSDPAECYRRYPHPPRVRVARRPRPTPTPTATATFEPTPSPTVQRGPPSAAFDRPVGRRGETFVLRFSGFRPSISVQISVIRPDGVEESHSATTNADGSGSFTFAQTGGNDVLGVYSVAVLDPETNEFAETTATLQE